MVLNFKTLCLFCSIHLLDFGFRCHPICYLELLVDSKIIFSGSFTLFLNFFSWGLICGLFELLEVRGSLFIAMLEPFINFTERMPMLIFPNCNFLTFFHVSLRNSW